MATSIEEEEKNRGAEWSRERRAAVDMALHVGKPAPGASSSEYWRPKPSEEVERDLRDRHDLRVDREIRDERELRMRVESALKSSPEHIRALRAAQQYDRIHEETRNRNARFGKVMTAVVIASGLLTTSTFPAIYGAYVSFDNKVLNASGANSTQTGHPVIADLATGYYIFRMLCTFSFVFSVVGIVGATIVLMQVAVDEDKNCSKVIYLTYVGFALLAFLTGGGASLIGALSFLEFGYGVTTVVVLGLGLLLIALISLDFYFKERKEPSALQWARVDHNIAIRAELELEEDLRERIRESIWEQNLKRVRDRENEELNIVM